MALSFSVIIGIIVLELRGLPRGAKHAEGEFWAMGGEAAHVLVGSTGK